MGRGGGGGRMVRVRAWVLHPLTDAPVADSWLYGVRRAMVSARLASFGSPASSQAMPIAQVLYGVRGRMRSAALGVAGNLQCLSRRAVRTAFPCARDAMRRAAMAGARGDRSADLQSLLTFLSFSFMSEIPFLTAISRRTWRSPRQRDGASSCGCG